MSSAGWWPAGPCGRQAWRVEFDEVADRLYRVDPEGFMPTRTAAAAEARAAGDRTLAARIAALKKPTRAAWLVNLLARENPDRLQSLDELAQRMASAHQGLDVASLRTLGAERQRLVGDLTAAAVTAGAVRGYRTTEAVRTEVDRTLTAAIADADVRAEVLIGRVVKAHAYSGFGFPMAAATASASGPASEPVPPSPGPQSDADLARRRAQEAVDAATVALADARAAVAAAENADAEARERLDRAALEVADLRAELRASEATELAAREAANAASDQLHEARGVVQQAEQALSEASRSRAAAG